MKKLIGLIIILAMAVSSLAKYSGGAGTPENPYKIADCNDLYTLADDTNDYNKCFIMTADIDLNPNLPGRRQLTTALIAPDIDNSNDDFDGTYFTGVFDGNDHKFTNLTINGGANDYLGLFGGIGNGRVSNLTLEGSSVGGDRYVGGLVGANNWGGDVLNCYSTGDVSGVAPVGGLVGDNDRSSISNCYSTGDVNGYAEVGGLVGKNNDYGSISDCYSTGDVNGNDYVGGLVGENYGSISNCYSTGSVTGSDDVGGLVGWNSGSVTNSYFLDPSDGGGPDNGIGELLTDTEMKQQSSFIDWNFIDIWSICEAMNYPKLLWQIPLADMLCPDGVTFIDYSYFADHWLWTDYGDVNGLELSGNGKIENADFALLASWWGQTSCGDCGGADYTGDNAVDSADLAMLLAEWLGSDYGDCEGAELTGDGFVDTDDALAFSSQWLQGF